MKDRPPSVALRRPVLPPSPEFKRLGAIATVAPFQSAVNKKESGAILGPSQSLDSLSDVPATFTP